jgi:hypothetical protein
MHDPADLDDDENWTGGFYELALQLGPRDDVRLASALGSGWAAAAVDGCWEHGSRRAGRWSHRSVELGVAALERYGHLHGVVMLPTGERTSWGAVAIREEAGDDWLDFYLPLGALTNAVSTVGGYPFESETKSLGWRLPIDDWFVKIARSVFLVAPFRLGLVGFEVSGMADGNDLEIPEERGMGYLVPNHGALTYHPATV